MSIVGSAKRIVYFLFLRQLCLFGYSVDVEEAKRDPEGYLRKLAKKVKRDDAEKAIAITDFKKMIYASFLFSACESIREMEEGIRFLKETFLK